MSRISAITGGRYAATTSTNKAMSLRCFIFISPKKNALRRGLIT
nr:MAG TPA: hypothetical protein [Caudoviricetes sp.]